MFLSLTNSLEEYSVTATAGLRAACCMVPDKSPTLQVSIMDKRGLQSQIPIAGMAMDKILLVSGTCAVKSSSSGASVAVSMLWAAAGGTSFLRIPSDSSLASVKSGCNTARGRKHELTEPGLASGLLEVGVVTKPDPDEMKLPRSKPITSVGFMVKYVAILTVLLILCRRSNQHHAAESFFLLEGVHFAVRQVRHKSSSSSFGFRGVDWKDAEAKTAKLQPHTHDWDHLVRQWTG